MRAWAIVLLLTGLVYVTGCATPFPLGSLYTEVKMPIGAGDAAKATKTGTAECQSFLGLVATGDASVEAAMKNGGITKVHHVDWHVENILGLIGKYKCVVYGE